MDTVTRLVVTDEQMDVIKAVIASATVPGAEGTVAFWQTVTPDEWAAASPEHLFNPMGWAIPQRQWTDICNAILTRADQLHPYAPENVSAALTFMNKGPSHYDDERE